jgi:hypothetical protein
MNPIFQSFSKPVIHMQLKIPDIDWSFLGYPVPCQGVGSNHSNGSCNKFSISKGS